MDGEVWITVQDQGQGFDWNTIPDPTIAENRLFSHGRGVCLMKTVMDEVTFEDSGSVVHMRKKPNVGSAVQKGIERGRNFER